MSECRFDGRVAIITGAGRGLGRAYAELLAERGAKVIVNDIGVDLAGDGSDASPAEEVVQAIVAAGGEAISSSESVANERGCQSLVQAALDRYGRIDILIHNAGIVRPGAIGEMTAEDFDKLSAVHFAGAFHLVSAAFPAMRDAGYGRIVLTSSIGGIYGNYNQTNYAMVKSGMIGLANVVGLEGAKHDVKCNIILPGALTRMAAFIDTTGYPELSPRQVAPVVGWLCHESCSVTAEMYISVGSRVARAFVGETRGAVHADWTIDEIGKRIGEIRDETDALVLAPVPDAHVDHMRISFDMMKSLVDS